MKKANIPVLLLILFLATIVVTSVSLAQSLPDAEPASGQEGEEDFISYLPVAVSPRGVVIADRKFTPHTIAFATGASVRWVNNDVISHTLTGDNGAFKSPVLAPGDGFTWQASQAGNYHYQSDYAAATEGAVVILDGGPSELFGGQSVNQEYLDSCGGCHGPDRQGGIGPSLIPDLLTESDSFYFDTIKNGVLGTIMPSWGLVGMTDAEVWMLVGYMRDEPDYEAIEWGMDEIDDTHEILVPEASLPANPTHTGNLDNLLLVTEREARSIAVFDGDTHTLLKHIDASYRAHGYAFDPTDDRWAYNIGRDGWLFKIDMYTLQAVTKVRVGHDARGLAISDDGKYLIAGNFIPTSAVILDAKTLLPLKVIETEGLDPDGVFVKSRVCITSDVASSPDGPGPYFILALKEAGQMWRIDYSKPDFPIAKVVDVGRILHDGFLSPDNTRFYIASQADDHMAVIDVVNWTLVEKIQTGSKPHPGSGATWEANSKEYGATVHIGEGMVTIWDLADNSIAAKVPTSGAGLFIRAVHNNPYVWADTVFGNKPNEIYIIDKETFAVAGVIDDGIQVLHPELTTNGKYVYISDWLGNAVRVYDATPPFALVAEEHDVLTPTGIFNTSRRYETLGH